MEIENLLHSEITEKIIKGFYHVYNTLGYGFLEKVYENALGITLKKYGLAVEHQVPIHVYFEGELVGEYFADLLVNGLVIIEVKAVQGLIATHEAQLINYLNATDKEVGLVLNFGPEAKFKRKVFANERKRKD